MNLCHEIDERQNEKHSCCPSFSESHRIPDSKRGNLPVLYVSTMSTEPTQGAKEVKGQDFMSPSHLSQSLLPQSF